MLRRRPHTTRLSVTEVALVVIAFTTVAGLLVLRGSGCDGSSVSATARLRRAGAHALPRRAGDASATPTIAAAFTTSKRPDLFRRAYFSFRARCLDCDAAITHWFAVDDGSSPDQLAAMRAVSSDVTWLTKPVGARGHVSSLNTVLDAVKAYDYLVFLEDDFYFVRDEAYVTKSLDVLARNASIGQVVFNERYSLTDTPEEAAGHVGGIPILDPATNATLYMLHEYVGPPGSPAWKAYFKEHPGTGSVHWPHFSLNSGVWRLAAMRDVGRFEAKKAFEFFYGLRYMARGWVTAFLPGRYSIHMGKALPGSRIGQDILAAMYERHGLALNVADAVSAYELNAVIR